MVTYGRFDGFMAWAYICIILMLALHFTGWSYGTLSANSHTFICQLVHRCELWVHWTMRSASSKTIISENQKVRISKWWKFQLYLGQTLV